MTTPRFTISILICCLLIIMPAHAQENFHYRIIEQADHDSSYFTQGFEISGGNLYESSGLYGKSRVRKYSPSGNTTIAETKLPDQYFAEGLTVFKNEVYVLTWRENTLLVLDTDSLLQKGEISYDGEGWGLTNNGAQFIMSDGSDTVYFRNAETLPQTNNNRQ